VKTLKLTFLFLAIASFSFGGQLIDELTIQENLFLPNNYRLSLGSVLFSTNPATSTLSVGELRWETTTRTLELGLEGDVKMQIGREMPVYVHNQTGSIIYDGDVVVVVSHNADIPRVELASVTNSTTDCVFGMATMDIAIGADGYVTAFGEVRNLLNTKFADFTEGDELFLGSVAGSITNAPLGYPYEDVCVGILQNKGLGGGESAESIVFVNPRYYKTWEMLDSQYETAGVTQPPIYWFPYERWPHLFWFRHQQRISGC
jgi:hypothetical protein